MVMIREVLYCKPGKVRDLLNGFKRVNAIMQKMGFKPFRLFTDMSGERFWTLVAEHEAETVDAFLQMEGKVMADKDAQQAMAGYHDLVEQGRRELYRVES